MPEIKVNFRGGVEAHKFLADVASGARELGSTGFAVGTPLPRGIFTDRGTSRGTPRTEWLSGLVGQANRMIRGDIIERIGNHIRQAAFGSQTPLQLAQGALDIGEKIAALARARAKVRTGKLRGSVQVVAHHGVGSRLGRRR